jgi:hypothetical protein
MIQSGWEEIQDSVVKVNQTTADAWEMVDINTTSTTLFQAGAGVGTTSLISGWVTIPQVLTIGTQGGDPAYTDVQPLSKRQGFKIPVGFNAAAIELTLGHDASNANYKTMLGHFARRHEGGIPHAAQRRRAVARLRLPRRV